VIRRREFITLLGGAAVSPIGARAQQPYLPVIGFLGASYPATSVERLRGFHLGLKEAGFTEGDNVRVVYRWAEDHVDRLSELAADLTRQRVAMIVTFGNAPTLAAKAASNSVPIVFGVGDDPVRLGLVTSLARPGGNLTGINYLSHEVVAKRLELLRALAPRAETLAVLVDPAVPPTEPTLRELEKAVPNIGLRMQVFKANTKSEINTAFESLASLRPDALFVGSSFLFSGRRVQLAHLATHHRIPATYSERQYCEAGGLMSYGASFTDAHHQIGVYAGRILQGAKPSDLPVVQSTKLELVINAEAARLLGLAVPPGLLAIADEVIE
jgi:ABC-type uncharacterized transport system substrate-binding protein